MSKVGAVKGGLAEIAARLASVLEKYREPGRNVAVLPSMNAREELVDARFPNRPRSFARGLHTDLAQALNLKNIDTHAGNNLSPAYFHGQVLPDGRASIPSKLVNASDNNGAPLYLSDNPLISVDSLYSAYSTTGGKNAYMPHKESMLWPFLLDDRHIAHVTPKKNGWESSNLELQQLLNEFAKREGLIGKTKLPWGIIRPAMEDAARKMELPSAVKWNGIYDEGPATNTRYGSPQVQKQNQLLLYNPETLINEEKLLPVFNDGVPYRKGGLIQASERSKP